MASAEQTIKLILAGENRLGDMFNSAGGQIDKFAGQANYLNSSVADMTSPLASLAGGILKVDAALTALVTGSLVYAFAKSKDFESASIELKKVLGDYPAALKLAEDHARSLSGTYGEASTEILRSTANFKQAGFDIEESMQLTKNALDLVIAGEVDAAQSSDLLIAALKGFKAPAEDAGRLIDILNEVSNNYATDVEQLAIGMAEISPIASTMGFSMEETAGVLTPVIEIFRSGGEAAVALKTGLLKLVDDNASVTGALESIGVSQHDANGALRSGKDILADVATAFKTLEQNEKLFVAQQLVGIEQSARMVTVFDNLSKTSEITAVAMGATGSAALEVAARLDSAEVSVNRFSQGLTNAFISMGDQFRDSAKESIDGATDIVNALDAVISSGGLDPLFDVLEAKLNSLGSFFSQVAGDIPEAFEDLDFAELLTALDDLGGEIEGLFDGLDLGTPEGLAAALQKLVDGVTGLANVTSGMVSGAKPFIEMLAGMLDHFIEMDSEGQKTIGTVTGFGGALNQLTGPVAAVLNGISGIGTGMQVLAGVQVVNLITKLSGGGGLSSAFGSVLGRIAPLAATLAGPAGIAALFALSATAVVGAAKGMIDYEAANRELLAAQERGIISTAALNEKYRDISAATGVAITSSQDLKQAMAEGTIYFDAASDSWLSGTDRVRDYGAEVRAASEASYDWNEEIKRNTDAQGNLIGVLSKTTETLSAQERAAIDTAAAYYELQGTTPELARRMAELEGMEEPFTKVVEETDKAKQKTEDFILGMESLASSERIKSMELSVGFNTAALEAGSKKAIATIENIGTSIDGTSDLLGSLFGELGDTKGFGQKWAIEAQIADTAKANQRALDDAHKAAEQQYKLNEQRLERMESGASVLKFDAENVSPALRLLLHEVLEEVQLEISGEADLLLLG